MFLQQLSLFIWMLLLFLLPAAHAELIYPPSTAVKVSSSVARLKSVLNWSASVMSRPFAKVNKISLVPLITTALSEGAVAVHRHGRVGFKGNRSKSKVLAWTPVGFFFPPYDSVISSIVRSQGGRDEERGRA